LPKRDPGKQLAERKRAAKPKGSELFVEREREKERAKKGMALITSASLMRHR
jgi:hypothetical protein